MKKQWTKTEGFNYIFLVDGQETGKMEINFNNMEQKARCSISGQVLEIKRTGFWKSGIEITDSSKSVILKAYPEKWYANTSIVEFGNRKLKLLIRNNPLAQLAITENDKDVLVYALAMHNREHQVVISSTGNSDHVLDFLLWYLFVPIAAENFGDDYSFLLMVS